MELFVLGALVTLAACGGKSPGAPDGAADVADAGSERLPVDAADVSEREGSPADVSDSGGAPEVDPGLPRLFDACLTGWPEPPPSAPVPVAPLDVVPRVLWSMPLPAIGGLNRPYVVTPNGIALAIAFDLFMATKEGAMAKPFHSAASEVLAPPIVDSAGNLYVADAGFIYSLDRDGAERWRRPVGPSAVQGEFAFPSYGLLADDGTLYWNMLDGALWRVRSTDGTPLGPAAFIGLRGGPRGLLAGVGHTVFVGDDEGGLSLMNADTGAWGAPLVDETGWRPVGVMGGSRIGLVAYGYLAGDASETQVFDRCGRRRWKVPGGFSRPVSIGFNDQLIVRDRAPLGSGYAESVRKFSADGTLISGPETTGSVAGGVLGADDVLYLLICKNSAVTLEARDASLKTKWIVDVSSTGCPADLVMAPGGIVYTVSSGAVDLLAIQTTSPGPAPGWNRRFGKNETGNMWIGK